MRIRTTQTASGNFALQVVSKYQGKVTIHAHIGTYRNDTEKQALLHQATAFIQTHDAMQQPLFSDQSSRLSLENITITRSQPLFLYRLLSACYDHLGLNRYTDPLIKDLVIARIWHPASKQETIALLTDAFGKSYALKTVYRHVKDAYEHGLKTVYQTALIAYTKQHMDDTLQLVFYDVTTLYFESIIKDSLRDFGFSKDNRSAQTQVVVGLVVNREGFPLYFDIFSGKTFEGHTFVPLIQEMLTLLGTQDLVVVADAAMISRANMEALDAKHIGFIVGARLFQLPVILQETISQTLVRQDRKFTVLPYNSWRLVCQYSEKRAAKDRSDREKQMERAKRALTAPSLITRRFRFLHADGDTYALNQTLVEQAKKLEGIKGYVTNTDLHAQTIIDRYHDLWRIENAFRITKSDLEARPIFHHLKETIIMHLTIVFAGLAISRHLELTTGWSIKKILTIAQKILTHTVVLKQTGETGTIETTIDDPELCGQLEVLRHLGY